jgi:hypothetical protein
MTRSRDRKETPAADVEIGATAQARRLRFRRKPETEVEFRGSPGVESDSHTERENLPEEIEPGKTYRDVRVGWIAGARIDDEAVRELEERIESKARKQGSNASEES